MCVSRMYVPITHQYTSLHRLPSLSCPPCFLYYPYITHSTIRRIFYVILNTQKRNFELRIQHTHTHIPHRSAHSPERGSHATCKLWHVRSRTISWFRSIHSKSYSTHQVTLHTKCHCTYKPFGSNCTVYVKH